MEFILKDPIASGDYDQYLELRWEYLRKPWGQPRESARDSLDPVAIHVLAQAQNGAAAGAGRVHQASAGIAKSAASAESNGNAGNIESPEGTKGTQSTQGTESTETTSAGLWQIRYMVVAMEYRRRGLGKQILAALEHAAYERGANKIVLHARENSVPFYLSCDYAIRGKSHRLYNAIQHFEMVKNMLVRGN